MWSPKDYYNNGRTMMWGVDLTAEQLAALDNGEVFLLYDATWNPYADVFKDSYGTTRERVY
jgi:hypothetical protein